TGAHERAEPLSNLERPEREAKSPEQHDRETDSAPNAAGVTRRLGSQPRDLRRVLLRLTEPASEGTQLPLAGALRGGVAGGLVEPVHVGANALLRQLGHGAGELMCDRKE